MFIAEYICIPNFNNNENNSPESLNASIATAIACYAFAEKWFTQTFVIEKEQNIHKSIDLISYYCYICNE